MDCSSAVARSGYRRWYGRNLSKSAALFRHFRAMSAAAAASAAGVSRYRTWATTRGPETRPLDTAARESIATP